MSTKLDPKAKLHCPHCEKNLDDPAEDYVVSGQVGPETKQEEQCGYCDEWFTCYRSKDNKIVVEKI